ncbi:MAG: hypothetical protein EBU90_14580 [Proteobacteria bacterium]|nr:hypothetical protein [Pseudomonadota bacterium]
MAYIKPQDAINDSNLTRSATQNAIFDALGLKADLSYVDILVPDQSGNSGKYLYTNGSTTSWETITFPPSGANTALSNLASVAINESLLFGTDGAKNIGSSSNNRPNNIFAKNRLNAANLQTIRSASFNLTGTHSLNGGTVTGVGSAYLSELNIGDSVSFSGLSNSTWTVLSITSDTLFTVINTGATLSSQTIAVYRGAFTSLDSSGNIKSVLNGSDVLKLNGQVLDASGWNNRAALLSIYDGYNDGDRGLSGGLNSAQFVTAPPATRTNWAVFNYSTNLGTPSVTQDGYGLYNESILGNSNSRYTNIYWFHNGRGNVKGLVSSSITDKNSTGIEVFSSSSAQTAIGAQFRAGAFLGGSGVTGYGVISLASSLSSPARSVGGLFLVGDGSVLTTNVNSALVADNTDTAYSVAVFKVNGVNKVVVDSSGNLNVANLTANTILAADASKNVTSFANGSEGYVLKIVSGAPAWAADVDTIGANTSLSNLASVAINEDLLFGTDASKNIGAVNSSRPNKEYLAYGLQIGGSTDQLGSGNNNSIWVVADSDTGTDPRIAGVRYSNSSSAQHRFSFRKSRGSLASPSAVQSGDSIGRFTWSAMGDASSFRDTAQIIVKVPENITNTSSPGYIEFQTTPSGSTSLQTRMTITSSGDIGINTSSPTEKLEVNGNIKAVSNLQLGGASSLLSGLSGAFFLVSETAVSPSRIEPRFYADNSSSARISFRKSRGTEASPTQALLNDELGRITFSGMGDANSFRDSARIVATAAENITNGSSAGNLLFLTTSSLSTVPQIRMIIDSAGDTKFQTGITVKSLHNQSGTINVSISDYYIGCNTAAPVTINLPAAATAGIGKTYIIKDETGQALTNNITVNPAVGENIDTASGYLIANGFQSITLVCDGSNWFMV